MYSKAIVCGIKKSVFFWLLAFGFWLTSTPANAQCAMCRASLETEGDAKKGEALNDGIVYLMVIPYLLVGGLGYYIYRTRLQKKK